MGTTSSAPTTEGQQQQNTNNNTTVNTTTTQEQDEKNKYRSFPGSAILEKTFCGSIDTTDPSEYEDVDFANRLLKKADIMCVSSPERKNRKYYDDNPEDDDMSYEDGDDILDNDGEYSDDEEEDEGFEFEGSDVFDDVNERPSRRRRSKNRRRSSRRSSVSSAADPSSALLARALVNEVTNNPKTMKPAEMAARELTLIKAQKAAAAKRGNGHHHHHSNGPHDAALNPSSPQAVGAPGVGVGPPHVLNSLAFAVTGDENAAALDATGGMANVCVHPTKNTVGGGGGGGGGGSSSSAANSTANNNSSMMPPGALQENRAAQEAAALQLSHNHSDPNAWHAPKEVLPPHTITLGLSLSRRHAQVGHPDTVTRQTAFDFNELQDRAYKYVSSTDEYGWRAGGGEAGGTPTHVPASNNGDDSSGLHSPLSHKTQEVPQPEKIAAPDTVHIPIIQIPCRSEAEVDQVIHALASGDIFIPHMAVLPEILSVNGISPPDLVVRFGCERNDDINLPPDEWPNWCLEFMHNQLYEYFYSMGAKWTKRPFSITLARKVKWKTVKHMNRYFSHAEKVISNWRQKGPQVLNPQLSYIEGGATPEEVAHPHGLYLFRQNGVATNYFCPNFDPPYTTKMTRSLLENVLNKSWDRKRREWTPEPIPRLVTPNMLLAMACGCATDPTSEGFMAKEVTMYSSKNAAANSAASKAKQEQQEAQMLMTMVTASSTQSSNKKTSAAASTSIVKPVVATTTTQQQSQQQQQPGVKQHSTSVTPKTAASSTGSSSSSPTGTGKGGSDEMQVQTVSTSNSNDQVSVLSDSKQSPQEQQSTSLRETDNEEKKIDDQETLQQHAQEGKRQQHEPEQVIHNKIKMASPAACAGCKPPISPPSNNEDTPTRSEFDGAATSVAATSQFGASVAMSSTTVMHTNVTTIMTTKTSSSSSRENEGSIQEDADPWKVSLTSPSVSASSSSSSRKGKSFDGETAENTNPAKTKHESKQVRDLLEMERKRQDELLSQVHSDSPDKTRQNAASKALSTTASTATTTYVLSPTNHGNTMSPMRKSSSNELEGSDSGQSMEYSQDGSSMYMTDGGSTLVGQNFAGDQSVLTMASKQSVASTTTASTINVKKNATTTTPSSTTKAAAAITATPSATAVVETDMDNLSIQESSSSVLSIVPTDEELFAIGWAKALDPNSGNYYYFTLDRKNIVWDNPLNKEASSVAAHSMAESSTT